MTNRLNEANETMPSPPVLKTTIIQLNKDLDQDDNNYEILTNDYSQNKESTSEMTSMPASMVGNIQGKKKRRRSSANVDSDELLKRKNDTKQLHSIIEKRRRIKINREFEALKYLIPACRLTSSGSGPNSKKGAGTNNGSKIDGMYKLTILKSSVEYILYLHHIIQQQHNLIKANDNKYKFDIDFARVPLDVNTYRNINKDFNFKDLITSIENASFSNSPKERDSVIEEDYEDESVNDDKNQLLSPDITPDMAPVLSMLNKYTPIPRESDSSAVSPNGGLQTAIIDNSPYNNPIKNYNPGKFNKFQLPDPALNPTEYDNEESRQYQYGPKRKLFKAKIPPNNTILFNRPLNIKCSSSDRVHEDKLSDQDASKTLLSLRKSSIDSLLN
mmetsp:Transcript_8014/g.10085  ORF Transcript_8014/g.10085 Transcript_8014/m.10085 type:complete len:387 (+) Transcript_8014:78-1238(+)